MATNLRTKGKSDTGGGTCGAGIGECHASRAGPTKGCSRGSDPDGKEDINGCGNCLDGDTVLRVVEEISLAALAFGILPDRHLGPWSPARRDFTKLAAWLGVNVLAGGRGRHNDRQRKASSEEA